MQSRIIGVKPHVPHRGRHEKRCAFPALSIVASRSGFRKTRYDFEWLDFSSLGEHHIPRWECQVLLHYGFFHDPEPNKFRPPSQLEAYRVEFLSGPIVFVGRHFYSKKLPTKATICWLYRWIPQDPENRPSGWYTWVGETRYPELEAVPPGEISLSRNRNVRAEKLKALLPSREDTLLVPA